MDNAFGKIGGEQATQNILTRTLGRILKELSRARRRLLGLTPPRRPRATIRRPTPGDSETVLRARYVATDVAAKPDTFVLYRIIGNDLVPRHAKGQARANLEFILSNEAEFANCEKRWIVNRIHDRSEEAAIVDILERFGQTRDVISFDLAEYARIGWDFTKLPTPDFLLTRAYRNLDPATRQRVDVHIRRGKNCYAINNNGARNAALDDGRARAKWVLPFDGNCFFTRPGFDALTRAIIAKPWFPYFIVPMARVTDNAALLKSDFEPRSDEEPQIVFRCDATEYFDPDFPYGRRSKVEMLWRLAVPGPWDRFHFDAWDMAHPPLSGSAGNHLTAGWVARLNSGRADLESGRAGRIGRGLARDQAIVCAVDVLDAKARPFQLESARLIYFDRTKIARQAEMPDSHVTRQLRQCAEAALTRGPYSVIDKLETAPSGDRHDYWHPAPYWWPDDRKPDGVPYLRRDGQRRPGTVLYDADSDRYDRTRLQRLFDDTTILTLASSVFGEIKYAVHAARLVRTWFVIAATRMNPHLRYAQVRRGHNDDEGPGNGIIEFKGIFYFLDAVRLLSINGALSPGDIAAFKEWLAHYAKWLRHSPAGVQECASLNNHGTYYDLQDCAIAAYLQDADTVSAIAERARHRLSRQLRRDGSLPEELSRSKVRHYICFSLAGWVALARIVEALGTDIWSFNDGCGRGLAKAFEWLARVESNGTWESEQQPLDPQQILPLWNDCHRRFAHIDVPALWSGLQQEVVAHPDYGFPPFAILSRD